jgi:hypothetical protein
MSHQKGNNKKEGQKHQNKTKFAHNPHSRLTQKILKTPLDHLCQRCFEQLQWKIDYHKYKPLTSFARCTDCQQKNIDKAYRVLCDTCCVRKRPVPVLQDKSINLNAITDEVPDDIAEKFKIEEMVRCSKCTSDVKQYAVKVQSKKDVEAEVESTEKGTEALLQSLKEREKRTIQRKLKAGVLEFDPGSKQFVYAEDGRQFKMEDEQDSDPEDEEEKDEVHQIETGEKGDSDADSCEVMSADSNDVCEQVQDKAEQEKIANDVTKDPDCKKMVKKLLTLDNRERNTIVKMLKRGILDFNV